jgi:multicomponent Na+:H+ antiporter subunit D
MPITGTTSLIASMSIAGIPPLNGFWSKLIIIVAAVQAERYWCACWAVVASILTLASFLKVMKYAFFGTLKDTCAQVREVPLLMRLSMSTLAIICLVGGLVCAPGLRRVFLTPAAEVMVEGGRYAKVVLGVIR